MSTAVAPRHPAPLPRTLRLALVQIRSHPDTAHHERRCVIEQAGLADEQLHAVNLVHQPQIRWQDVADADAVVLGGSGDHTVTRDYAFTPALIELIHRIADEGKPFLGICWGHHMIGRALGGRVITDPEREEVGTFEVQLTEAGREDPIFGPLGPRFDANLVHHDSVVELPPGAVELGWSERCRYQILRMEGKPIYGTQFHGEMDRAALCHRLGMYSWEYVEDATELEETCAAIRETPAANTVLRRFLAAMT